MKIKRLVLVCLLPLVAQGAQHGLSFDLNHGLGYTLSQDRLWGGISLNATQRRFVDNQIVISPRVYANYNLNQGKAPLFVGASYLDQFGLRDDSRIDKHRLLAAVFGVTATVAENLQLATWVNLWAVRDDLIFDSTTGRRAFDPAANRQSFLDFGGLLVTYYF